MINLLPEEEKKQLRAARANVILLRYTIVLACAGAFLALIFAGSYFLLEQNRIAAQNFINVNGSAAPGTTPAAPVNIAEASTILSNQTAYSKVLVSLAQAMPAGTVIDTVAFDATTPGTPVQATVYAQTASLTTDLQTSLQATPLFSTAVVTPGTAAGISGYPFSASLTFTLPGVVN
jgi:hypothetical protein